MPRTRTRKIPPDFRKNVFINCPFDDDYLWLFRAIGFTVRVLGFNLRCALEESNAGNTRIDKIQNIIAACKYSIHDLICEGLHWSAIKLGFADYAYSITSWVKDNPLY